MAITTVEGFIEALEKSGLLEEAQLAEARQIASQAADAKSLARALVQKGLLSRWQAAQLLAGRTSVFFLGKYKLIEMLGRGGMGGVFLAHHTMMNRQVALKVISKQIAQDPAALEQFLAEARAIAALDHPNIVRAYNVDCEDGRYYLVMEYVEGKDLQRLVEEEGPLDFQKVADYIRQAAEGLAHAHQRNLIHCDIKPSNLLITEDGVVKILDLGLARLAAKETKQKTADPRLVGTVDYQAPELAMGNRQVDARSDIYSLGCTMFFLLTGRPPFGEGTLHERIVKHQTQPPPDIAALRPGTPKNLAAICRKMMAKKPENRFQSVEQVSKLLAQWRPPQPKLRKAVPLEQTDSSSNSESTEKASSPSETVKVEVKPVVSESSTPARSGPEASPLAQLPPWVWIAGGAAAVVLVGLVIVWLVMRSAPPAPAAHATGPAKFSGPKVEEEPSFIPPPSSKDPSEPKPPESSEPGVKPKPSEPTSSEKPTPPKPEAKPSPKPEEKPSPKPEEKSTPTPQEKTDSKPETKPAPKSEKPDSKPPAKPEPTSKPQPKQENPPDKLPKEVDLPILEGKEEPSPKPTPLVQLPFTSEDIWDLTLIGERLVFKGGQPAFRLELPKKRTDTGYQWQVLLDKGGQVGTDSSSVPVALFEYKNENRQLFFQWLPGADPAQAGLLRNCILGIYTRGETRPILLRKPVAVPPLEFHPLKLARPTTTAEIPDLPTNTEKIFIVVDPAGVKGLQEIEGLKTGVEFQPKGPNPLGKPFSLVFQWTDRANNKRPGITIQITPRLEGKRLRLQAQLKAPSLQEFRLKHTLEEAVGLVNKAGEIRKQLEADSNKKPNEKRLSQNERNLLLQQINQLDAQAWFIRMQHALQSGMEIHYKVLFEISDKYKVELAHTQESSSPNPPAPKK